jgi:hypothetical protein
MEFHFRVEAVQKQRRGRTRRLPALQPPTHNLDVVSEGAAVVMRAFAKKTAILKRAAIFPWTNMKLRNELVAEFPLMRHGPCRKRRLQQFSVVASLWLAAERERTHADAQTMGGTSVVRRCDGPRGHDIHEDWFRRSDVNGVANA